MSNDQDKLNALNAKPYKVQAVTFLNAFWERDPVRFGANVANVEKVRRGRRRRRRRRRRRGGRIN